MQVTLLVLPHLHPLAVVVESAQVAIEPPGNVGTTLAHEVDFLIGDEDILQEFYLMHHLIGETFRIDGVVAIDELILHLSTWEIVNHGTAHRQLIEVVVGEVLNNLTLNHNEFC